MALTTYETIRDSLGLRFNGLNAFPPQTTENSSYIEADFRNGTWMRQSQTSGAAPLNPPSNQTVSVQKPGGPVVSDALRNLTPITGHTSSNGMTLNGGCLDHDLLGPGPSVR